PLAHELVDHRVDVLEPAPQPFPLRHQLCELCVTRGVLRGRHGSLRGAGHVSVVIGFFAHTVPSGRNTSRSAPVISASVRRTKNEPGRSGWREGPYPTLTSFWSASAR